MNGVKGCQHLSGLTAAVMSRRVHSLYLHVGEIVPVHSEIQYGELARALLQHPMVIDEHKFQGELDFSFFHSGCHAVAAAGARVHCVFEERSTGAGNGGRGGTPETHFSCYRTA